MDPIHGDIAKYTRLLQEIYAQSEQSTLSVTLNGGEDPVTLHLDETRGPVIAGGETAITSDRDGRETYREGQAIDTFLRGVTTTFLDDANITVVEAKYTKQDPEPFLRFETRPRNNPDNSIVGLISSPANSSAPSSSVVNNQK